MCVSGHQQTVKLWVKKVCGNRDFSHQLVEQVNANVESAQELGARQDNDSTTPCFCSSKRQQQVVLALHVGRVEEETRVGVHKDAAGSALPHPSLPCNNFNSMCVSGHQTVKLWVKKVCSNRDFSHQLVEQANAIVSAGCAWTVWCRHRCPVSRPSTCQSRARLFCGSPWDAAGDARSDRASSCPGCSCGFSNSSSKAF
ncbi:hypothetical protein L7F22_027810 [Adiantum nelumboides]|nr:hypothetical protein [Adiantum nelumboides]